MTRTSAAWLEVKEKRRESRLPLGAIWRRAQARKSDDALRASSVTLNGESTKVEPVKSAPRKRAPRKPAAPVATRKRSDK